MFHFLVFLVLAAVIGFLAYYGAGVFGWTLCVTSAVLLPLTIWQTFRLAKQPMADGDLERRKTSGRLYGLMGAVLIFLGITLIPIPVSLSGLAGAERSRDNRHAAATLQAAEKLQLIPDAPMAFPLTRNAPGTLRMATLWLTVFACFGLAAGLPAVWRPRLLHLLIFTGAIIGAAGMVHFRIKPQGDLLWWRIPVEHSLPGPAACFINRNHFAGFMAMMGITALASALTHLQARQWFKTFLCITAFAVMGAALLLSGSRGATIALAIGLFALPLFSLRRQRIRQAVLALAVVGALGACAVSIIRELPQVRARYTSLSDPRNDDSVQRRAAAWVNVIKTWRHYPVIGCGANALRMVYPQHRITSERARRLHAENEIFQILAEAGLVGIALAILLVVAYVKAFRTAADPLPLTRMAAMAAGTVAAAHAFVDFPLHVPLYAMALSLILGAALAPMVPDKRVWMPAVAALALALAALPRWQYVTNGDAQDALNQAGLPPLASLMRAMPTSSQVWFNFAVEAHKAAPEKSKDLMLSCLAQAGACDPNNYLLWLEIGKNRLMLGDNDGARAAFRRVRELRSWVTLPPVPRDKP